MSCRSGFVELSVISYVHETVAVASPPMKSVRFAAQPKHHNTAIILPTFPTVPIRSNVNRPKTHPLRLLNFHT